ncbi:hypothetical protein V5739_14405 [Salinimicrobium sp. TIG7-5_MAKvit]|uniref:hypothetical protein n=1 Tax=Salinimicrobium sp. TIG7-5_MAKvit TaxID=3121289 RepID=UPI003C6DFB19
MNEQAVSSRNNFRKLELFAYLIFFISNFLMLINPGVFWDDWTIFNMDDKGLMNQYYGNGNLIFGYIHLFLKNFSGSLWLYHALSFSCQLLNIYLLFKIMSKLRLRNQERLFFSIAIVIFAVFPIHDAKATIIIFPHILCLTAFIMGSFLLLKYIHQNKLVHRILSLLFFLFAFLINSHLVFYALPIFFILFHEYWVLFFRKKYKNLKALARSVGFRVLSYIDFLVLPFVFWFIKLSFLKPSMQYKSIGYNTVKLESLLEIPYRTVVFLYVSLTDIIPIILEAIIHIEIWVLLVVFSWISYKHFLKLKLDFTVSWRYAVWGLVVLILGAFPYLMVNKYPSYLDYLSRHQLLLGFGFSLLFCAVIFLLKSEFLKRIIFSLSISSFMAVTIFLHFSYFKGYIKQEVFQDYFLSSSHFPSKIPETIILIDHTENFTQKGNPTKFYAFAGMLKKQYPNENTLLVRPEDWKGYLKSDLFPMIAPYYFQYNLTNYEFRNPNLSLEVNYKEQRPLFPMWAYYSDFLTGNSQKWNKYFSFNLKPIE